MDRTGWLLPFSRRDTAQADYSTAIDTCNLQTCLYSLVSSLLVASFHTVSFHTVLYLVDRRSTITVSTRKKSAILHLSQHFLHNIILWH